MDRLRRSGDFSRVQGTGRKYRSPHLLLLAVRTPLPKSQTETTLAVAVSRFGLTVSRKVGNAVKRNQVKRWLREIVREIPPPQQGIWDLVLIPHPTAVQAGFHVLRDEVTDLFRRMAK
jgi:ribonuclease P protein component